MKMILPEQYFLFYHQQ